VEPFTISGNSFEQGTGTKNQKAIYHGPLCGITLEAALEELEQKQKVEGIDANNGANDFSIDREEMSIDLEIEKQFSEEINLLACPICEESRKPSTDCIQKTMSQQERVGGSNGSQEVRKCETFDLFCSNLPHKHTMEDERTQTMICPKNILTSFAKKDITIPPSKRKPMDGSPSSSFLKRQKTGKENNLQDAAIKKIPSCIKELEKYFEHSEVFADIDYLEQSKSQKIETIKTKRNMDKQVCDGTVTGTTSQTSENHCGKLKLSALSLLYRVPFAGNL